MDGFNEIQLGQIKDLLIEVLEGKKEVELDSVTVQEAAKILGKSKDTIYKKMKLKHLDWYKNEGEPIRITKESLKNI